MNIKYDPWEEEYKTPFGAVKSGTRVTLTIEIFDADVNQIQICLIEDYSHKKKTLNLEQQKESEKYQITLTLPTGLYFYYFVIKSSDNNQKQITYFGKNGITKLEELSKYQLTVFEEEVSKIKWYRSGTCYQIFPDSFYASSNNFSTQNIKKDIFIYGNKNDSPVYIKKSNGDILRWTFYGGNLRGIIQKIPYLKSLGVGCVYLNPIFQSTSTHRYDTDDYFKTDDLLGNDDDFDQLVRAFRKNGIHLILDGVFDHVGVNSFYFNKNGIYGTKQGAFRNKQSRYYSWFTFNDYPDDYQCWWGVKDMPQIKKDNQDFHNFIAGKKGVIDYWTQRGVDGWRLDVADELTDEFISEIRQRLANFSNKILIGEVWEDASNKISYNQRRKYVLGNTLDGSMNYPLRKGIVNLLNNQQVKQTALSWMQLCENYPYEYMLNCLNNIGTHDTERILTVLGGNLAKLKIAVGLLFMFPGVPCIYYGDEVGLEGGKDPDNRAYYPWEKENRQVFKIYKEWIDRRKRSLAMQEGGVSIFICENVIGIIRYLECGKANIYFANCGSIPTILQIDKIKIYRKCKRFKEYLAKNYGNRRMEAFESIYCEI